MVKTDSKHLNPSGLTTGSPQMGTCNPIQSSQYWALVAPRTSTAPKPLQMTSKRCKTCAKWLQKVQNTQNKKKNRPKPTFLAKVMAI